MEVDLGDDGAAGNSDGDAALIGLEVHTVLVGLAGLDGDVAALDAGGLDIDEGDAVLLDDELHGAAGVVREGQVTVVQAEDGAGHGVGGDGEGQRGAVGEERLGLGDEVGAIGSGLQAVAVLVFPVGHMVQVRGIGDDGDLGAVVNTIGDGVKLDHAGGKGGGIDAHQIGTLSLRVAVIFPAMGHDGNVGAFHDAHAFKLLILHVGSEKAIDIYRCGIIRQVEIAVGCVGDIGDGAGDFVPHLVVDHRGEELRDGFAAAVAAGGAFEHHLTPGGVVGGEGEDGLVVEGGGGGHVAGEGAVGLLDSHVAVGVVVLVEAHEVGGVARRGLDGDAGVVVYIICISVGDGGHVAGGNASGDV